MKFFYAILDHDEGGAFGLTFPDLPGCFASADSLNDLMANAQEALSLWLSDSALTEPSDINLFHAIAAEDLREGGVIIAVPFETDDNSTITGHNTNGAGE